MKHREKDAAARLLHDYLAHVESWVEEAARPDRTPVIVLDVMEYRQRLHRIVKGKAASVRGPASR